MEIALSQYCSREDILTPLTPDDESIRLKLYNITARNYEWQWSEIPVFVFLDILHSPIRYLRWFRKPLKGGPIKLRFYNHIPAHRLRNAIGKKRWDEYYKFTIDRNPWDKAVSRYYWDLARGRVKINQNFDEYIEYLYKETPRMLSNWHIYAYQDNILVDKVIKYEDIAAGLKEVGNTLGLSALALPEYRAKGGYRRHNNASQEFMTDHASAIIAAACSKEINAFGYRCPYE